MSKYYKIWKATIGGVDKYFATTTDEPVNFTRPLNYNEQYDSYSFPYHGSGNEDYYTLEDYTVNAYGDKVYDVRYNKTKGNWVKIDAEYDVDSSDYYFVFNSASDDFVPDSEGATYIFRTPLGITEMVIGETYYDAWTSEDVVFHGGFGFMTTTNPVVRPRGSCYVEPYRNSYRVTCLFT